MRQNTIQLTVFAVALFAIIPCTAVVQGTGMGEWLVEHALTVFDAYADFLSGLNFADKLGLK